MSDSEFFKQYREDQQKRRAKRLPERQLEIENLEPNYKVKKLTEYQYRINEVLDLYPIHKNWHNIKLNKRGKYDSLESVLKVNNIKTII